jgi:hypothetical protein
MVKRIKFKIDSQGEVRLDVSGAEGADCEDLTKPFEQVLGSVLERSYKDSYYIENTENQSVTGENDERV